ncbi:NADPH-dependent F420 reductase [Gloeocapsopsis dulcis]|uniref:F420-dependent NADP oxidoreductase n=1 Tax=Gloeocapsopsis dulcis AAB1 = 1H9 TaxID=1433147 RepID=A0A6N8G5I7_9CHRO|nr:NADPH-dependent F420 reductase [Gloeocapsopsis dulcis]MUL39257.1 F420-dependent NADP oxidoreductase [Gloeocapsopsis dulcis AAB1 = 1H9]WNN92344.1 NADPH-dependent F420 reductase [Gloeocapsopsis dulcis]
MKIGIIGSGNMGRSLGILWAEQGHEVFFGSRTTKKGKEVAEIAGQTTQGGSNDEAAAFGDVLLYTVRGVHPAEVFSSTSVIDNKILIDCNNQEISENFDYPAITQSLAEKLAAEVPNAKVVKAFNTMAQELFELAPIPLKNYNVSVFVAGDDESAKQTVIQLVQEIGFQAINCGELRHARLIESAGDLIRLLMIQQQMGSYATISVRSLPPAETQRLGGRQASNLK